MLAYAALGLAVCVLLVLFLRWFAQASVRDIATALKTFAAVFTALASTGLIFTGRFGLALITIAAAVMAVRALAQSRRGADAIGAGAGPSSRVETRMLVMTLDHVTGDVVGEVTSGSFAGRELATMGLSELQALLAEARREDPPSVPLLEAYLDRRDPAWREAEAGTGSAAPPGDAATAMDERTALEILGLEPGADEEAIRAAHRKLMARLHPDHGGSSYLASQINRARDYLLRRR